MRAKKVTRAKHLLPAVIKALSLKKLQGFKENKFLTDFSAFVLVVSFTVFKLLGYFLTMRSVIQFSGWIN